MRSTVLLRMLPGRQQSKGVFPEGPGVQGPSGAPDGGRYLAGGSAGAGQNRKKKILVYSLYNVFLF